ncbi:MAG TPA: hypothetical protein VEY06_02225 [Flavisolibacter sp.]|nr:hypothetical protein [Flavisolibacter sp.]
MRPLLTIGFLFSLLCLAPQQSFSQSGQGEIDFYGVSIRLPINYEAAIYEGPLTASSITSYIGGLDTATLQHYLEALLRYKEVHRPDDWLFYQLVRKVAQYISPKADNYYRYTFYKWWFLTRSGYNAKLTLSKDYLLFYVQCDEAIYNIPYRMEDSKQYVCLNYHDYGTIDFSKHRFADVTPTHNTAAGKPFSYKVNQLPHFELSDYTEKDVQFSDGLNRYTFRIKLNPQVKTIFTNYPVVDYNLQFNMPLSKTTHESLIPSLKKEVRRLKQKDGVEFLMRFTRYAFLFKPDVEVFGTEKRLSAEQTLLHEFSDCEDRAALFFFLVKEIYNLPMLVLTFPKHVTVAVQFDKPFGQTIEYGGMRYSICEPSPQAVDLRIGQAIPELAKEAYQVAYAYQPVK